MRAPHSLWVPRPALRRTAAALDALLVRALRAVVEALNALAATGTYPTCY